MKNNREKILNYLSDQMNREEKQNFEGELNNSSELKQEYDEFKAKLEGFSFDESIAIEEDYFINLLPKVRTRLEKDIIPFYKKKIVLAVPVLTAIIVAIIFISNGIKTSSNNNYITFDELENVLYTNNNLDEKLASQLWEEKLSGNYQIPLYEIDKYYNNLNIDNLINKESIEYLNNDFPDINSSDLYKGLKEKDVESFYKTLMKKNIIGIQ